MTQAIPPKRSWGGGWPILIVVIGLLGSTLLPASGQQPGGGAAGKGAPDPKKQDEKSKGEAEAKAAEESDKPDGPERWEDRRAAEALAVEDEILAPAVDRGTVTVVNNLANGQGRLDLSAIDRYVKGYASDLTKRANIKALADPAGNPSAAKAMEDATSGLIKPLLPPMSGSNRQFRQQYVNRLIQALAPLWKGNLHSRTMAMIVLSQTADPQAVPVFTAQINDPEQLAIVKLLAAKGITNVTRNGRIQPADPRVAAQAAEALDGFLNRETDTFWAAQMRALEALGSLRLSSPEPLGGKAEFSATAMTFLSDPKARPFVRVWAAWALGTIQVPALVRDYNYPLVAYATGKAAADIGSRVAAVADDDLGTRAWRLTDLLVQLNLAFTGEPEVRGAGLLNAPGAGSGYILEVEKRVRAVTKAGLDLRQAVGIQIPDRRKAVIAAVDDLRAFLAKPPQGPLFAGGPDLAQLIPKTADGGQP